MALAHPALHATPSADREARILATVAHAGGIFGIAPAAGMFLVLRDHDAPTTEQARLALNWQLTLAVLFVAVVIADFVASTVAFSAGAFQTVGLLGWILLLPWAVGAAVAVWAGIRIWRSGTWTYPLSIPFVGAGAAQKRRELLDVLAKNDAHDLDDVTPLATLALWFGVLGGLLGIVFGYVARARIRRTGEPGWGTATAGLAIGFTEICLGGVIVVSILASITIVAPLAN